VHHAGLEFDTLSMFSNQNKHTLLILITFFLIIIPPVETYNQQKTAYVERSFSERNGEK